MEGLMWGVPWAEGQEKNEIHFEKTRQVMRDLFESFGNFDEELGNGYTFLDLACAPGGFSRFLCSDTRCDRGWGVTLPVNEGGFKLLFTWNSPEERKFQVKFRDLLTLEPQVCCDRLVDICLSDAQYLPLRKTDEPGPDPSLARAATQNPSLGIWALLFQQLRLGLANLRDGGIMVFRLNHKDNVEWYYDCVCRLLGFLDSLFVTMGFFKSGASHQADGTFYMVCRGFCRAEFDAMGGEELLRRSMSECIHESDVLGLCDMAIFQGAAVSASIRSRTSEIFDHVRQLIARYKDQRDFAFTATVREWRCSSAHPHLERVAQEAVRALLPLAVGDMAATHLERAASKLVELAEPLAEESGLGLAELRSDISRRCDELAGALRAHAAEVRCFLQAARPVSRGGNSVGSSDCSSSRLRTRSSMESQPKSQTWEPPPCDTLHVSDLPKGIAENSLDAIFSQAGEVVEVHVLAHGLDARCAALVRMASEEEAVRARVLLDGAVPQEITPPWSVQFQRKAGVTSADHLYIKGLPQTVTKQQLLACFARYGTVLWAAILSPPSGQDTSLERTALVQMASTDQAQCAIQALSSSPPTQFRQPLRVRYAESTEAKEVLLGRNDRFRDTASTRWGQRRAGASREAYEGPRLWNWGMRLDERLGPEGLAVEFDRRPEPEDLRQGADAVAESKDARSHGEPADRPSGRVLPDDTAAAGLATSCRRGALTTSGTTDSAEIFAEPARSTNNMFDVPDTWEDVDLGDKAAAEADTVPDSWEALLSEAPSAVPEDSGEEQRELEPSDQVCVRNVPPEFPDSLVQFWFRPYGTVVRLRRLDASTAVVSMSRVEEAIAAMAGLRGKSSVRGMNLQIGYAQEEDVRAFDGPRGSTGIDGEALLKACRAAMKGRAAKHDRV